MEDGKMNKAHQVKLAAMLLALTWGVSSKAEAGCGGNSSCGMSNNNVQQAADKQTNLVQYTCPMHPEVVSNLAGNCPKCGMNLIKVEGKAAEKSDANSDMAAQCRQLTAEFKGLQDHFDTMMKLTDVDDLAPAMIKHSEMMDQFAKHLEKHLEMCRQMSSGASGQKPDDTVTSIHKH